MHEDADSWWKCIAGEGEFGKEDRGQARCD